MAEATAVPAVEIAPTEQMVTEAPAEIVKDDQKPAAESAPAETPVEPAEVKTDEQPERPGKNRYQRRLDAANRKYYEANARADFLEKQIAELKPKVSDGAPRMDQFSDIEEYASAKGKYEREQGIKEYETQQRALAHRQTQEKLQADWEKKADRGASKYDDFEEVVGTLQPVNTLVAAVMQADNAEDVAYYLGTHPAEASKIAALDPVAQVRAVGKLEAKLEAEPRTPKTPPKVPAPITPVGGKSGGGSDLPQDSDDIQTWMKKANAQSQRRMSGT